MKSKVRTALLLLLTTASIALAAAPRPQIDDIELVAKLCGRLDRIDRVPDKAIPDRYSEKYRPIKDAKLVAYERHSNSECCETAPVAASITSGKSGNFEFKGLPKGYYWLVAQVDKKEYRMAIRIGQLQDKQPVCSQMSFAIDESGKFILRFRAPGR